MRNSQEPEYYGASVNWFEMRETQKLITHAHTSTPQIHEHAFLTSCCMIENKIYSMVYIVFIAMLGALRLAGITATIKYLLVAQIQQQSKV